MIAPNSPRKMLMSRPGLTATGPVAQSRTHWRLNMNLCCVKEYDQKMKVEIPSIVLGSKTYINRDGHSYDLKVGNDDGSLVEVYYEITSGAARRVISRKFPIQIEVNDRFLWVLGLLRGEGLRSHDAQSSMYRFNVVNNDLEVIRAVIQVLDESGLAAFSGLKSRPGLIRISYGPHCNKTQARRYWAKGLGIPLTCVKMAREAEPQKRARFGSCMFTLNDVLLRRIVDLVALQVYSTLFSQNSGLWNS